MRALIFTLAMLLIVAPSALASSHTGAAAPATDVRETQPLLGNLTTPAECIGVWSPGGCRPVDLPVLGAPALETNTPIRISPTEARDGVLLVPLYSSATLSAAPDAAVPTTIPYILVEAKSAAPGTISFSSSEAVYDTVAAEIRPAEGSLPTVAVTTQEEILISSDVVQIATPNGLTTLEVLPHEIPAIAMDIGTIERAELVVTDDFPVYDVEGITEAKLLGFIPVTMDVSTEINAVTGEVVATERPFWSFLTTSA